MKLKCDKHARAPADYNRIPSSDEQFDDSEALVTTFPAFAGAS